MTPLVLKLGGELVETLEQRSRIARFAKKVARTRRLVLVHGGGRAVDAELTRRQIVPTKVDGLRVTDAATLHVVVSVLAGVANTELVAALVSAGLPAVGLTGVDAALGKAVRVSTTRPDGTRADLGFVGDPEDADPTLIRLLHSHDYLPVVASIGLEHSPAGLGPGDPVVLNVNADVMACRIAVALSTADLAIAGGTPGVLDDQGQPIVALDMDDIERVISRGTATAGMVAKLSACRVALERGVATIRIIDGRDLDEASDLESVPGTLLKRVSAATAGDRHRTGSTTGAN